jgi:hypothetical protein
VEQLFSRQAGLASVSQLLAAGVSREALRSRLRRGLWRFVLPRVVADTARPIDGMTRLIAAQLMAGESAVIAGSTAAAWYGLRAAGPIRKVLVEVPHDRHIRGAAFVVIRRTRRPHVYAFRTPTVRVSLAPRAVADAAREAPGRARALVLEAVQRQVVTVDELRHELESGPRRGSAALRRALPAVEAGAWSVPEADLVAIVASSKRLPEMWSNPTLTDSRGGRLPRPDGWFDDVGLAVQVHSRQFHAGELDWEATVSADGVFAEHGIALVAVTPKQIATDPDAVRVRIERAYEQARRRPRPEVVAVPIASAR